VGWLARVNPWTWRWRQETRPNFQYYLTGLLIAGVILALLRAALMFVSTYMAARPRPRPRHGCGARSITTPSAWGRSPSTPPEPSEAVGVFTRHLEAVHDAMYVWLTVLAREPVRSCSCWCSPCS